MSVSEAENFCKERSHQDDTLRFLGWYGLAVHPPSIASTFVAHSIFFVPSLCCHIVKDSWIRCWLWPHNVPTTFSQVGYRIYVFKLWLVLERNKKPVALTSDAATSTSGDSMEALTGHTILVDKQSRVSSQSSLNCTSWTEVDDGEDCPRPLSNARAPLGRVYCQRDMQTSWMCGTDAVLVNHYR